LVDRVIGQDVPDHHHVRVGAGEDRFAFGFVSESALEPGELGTKTAVVLGDPAPGRFAQDDP
jgi:hypothetical protein